MAAASPSFLIAPHRSGNFSSTFLKMKVLYLGMFERYLFAVPEGAMWSVVILSPTLIATLALSSAGIGVLEGGVPMFGPRRTSFLPVGFVIMLSSMAYEAGSSTRG